MSFLLDTNVVSELRKRNGNAGVKSWVAAHRTTDLFLSVITIIEIETGVLLRERTDPAQGRALRDWLENSVLTGFHERILPLDLQIARRVAALHVPDHAPQHDALIAGTALTRGLDVVTRNSADFTRTGVTCVNPWA